MASGMGRIGAGSPDLTRHLDRDRREDRNGRDRPGHDKRRRHDTPPGDRLLEMAALARPCVLRARGAARDLASPFACNTRDGRSGERLSQQHRCREHLSRSRPALGEDDRDDQGNERKRQSECIDRGIES